MWPEIHLPTTPGEVAALRTESRMSSDTARDPNAGRWDRRSLMARKRRFSTCVTTARRAPMTVAVTAPPATLTSTSAAQPRLRTASTRFSKAAPHEIRLSRPSRSCSGNGTSASSLSTAVRSCNVSDHGRVFCTDGAWSTASDRIATSSADHAVPGFSYRLRRPTGRPLIQAPPVIPDGSGSTKAQSQLPPTTRAVGPRRGPSRTHQDVKQGRWSPTPQVSRSHAFRKSVPTACGPCRLTAATPANAIVSVSTSESLLNSSPAR